MDIFEKYAAYTKAYQEKVKEDMEIQKEKKVIKEYENEKREKRNKAIEPIIQYFNKNLNEQYGGHAVGMGSTIVIRNGYFYLKSHNWSYFGGCNPDASHQRILTDEEALNLAKDWVAKGKTIF